MKHPYGPCRACGCEEAVIDALLIKTCAACGDQVRVNELLRCPLDGGVMQGSGGTTSRYTAAGKVETRRCSTCSYRIIVERRVVMRSKGPFGRGRGLLKAFKALVQAERS